MIVHSTALALDGYAPDVEHQFAMKAGSAYPQLAHRSARVRLRVTRHQADRCYGLLRSAGDHRAYGG